MDKQENKFKEYIFKDYSKTDRFEETEYKLLRIRNVLLKKKSFQKLSLKSQYDLCCSVALITIADVRNYMNSIKLKATPLAPDEIIKQYSSDFGFEEPSRITIEVNDIQMLH